MSQNSQTNLSENHTDNYSVIDSDTLKKLKKLSPIAFDKENRLRTLKEQGNISRELEGFINVRYPFVVLSNTKHLQIPEIGDKPLLLTRSAVKHIFNRHCKQKEGSLNLDELLDTLVDLKSELENNLIAYQDYDYEKNNHICFVTNKKSEHQHPLLIVTNTNKDIGCYEVNSIVTVHGKEQLFKHIKKCLENNRKIYFNEKTADWLNLAAHGVPKDCGDVINQLLVNFNKIQNQNQQKSEFICDVDDRNTIAAEAGKDSQVTISREER